MERVMYSLHENRDEHFGNGRLVRNLFEHVQQEHANRLSSVAEPSREELFTIEAADIEEALAAIQPEASAESEPLLVSKTLMGPGERTSGPSQ
jgi:hypothetical protein